jgi:hypothetical protein
MPDIVLYGQLEIINYLMITSYFLQSIFIIVNEMTVVWYVIPDGVI